MERSGKKSRKKTCRIFFIFRQDLTVPISAYHHIFKQEIKKLSVLTKKKKKKKKKIKKKKKKKKKKEKKMWSLA